MPKLPATVVRPELRSSARNSFTLIELLIALALTLMLMAAVTTMFARLAGSINDSRSTLEMADRLRTTAQRLQLDLAGLTVTPIPPRRPEDGEGYLEIIEGPKGVLQANGYYLDDPNAPSPGPYNVPWPAVDSLAKANPGASDRDTTVGDTDDILMFTSRSADRPFTGKANGAAARSDVAEIAWFVRGNTLYRRVLLVAPQLINGTQAAAAFYNNNDISVRAASSSTVIANSLGDLTDRANRFAHRTSWVDTFPFDVRRWGQLRLPLLQECSDANWNACLEAPPGSLTPWSDASLDSSGGSAADRIDQWRKPLPWTECDAESGSLTSHNGPRVGEDVILTNVLSFDVKVWEPGPTAARTGPPAVAAQPARFVDLGYDDAGPQNGTGVPQKLFHKLGNGSNLTVTGGTHRLIGVNGTGGTASTARVYDSWSTQYAAEAVDSTNHPLLNGMDDDGDGVIDDMTMVDANGNGTINLGDVAEAPELTLDKDGVDDGISRLPPYPAPLRAIQVQIRCFDPDSRQIRDVTVVQQFLPK